ncbi:hypothetical protein IGI37_000186 [Enterococcus sp. AZ194]|uniref:ABC transporter permease n=1 Tax=Enterococcus sp. AZ194 TaxID=2774629 RepID=UPI003F24DA82
MEMKKLIQIEMQKMNIKSYVKYAVIANVAIVLLVFLTTVLSQLTVGEMPSIATTTVIDSLVKATFLVWEAVLIANLVIEEYRSKTILLLFSYPVERKKVILSKLVVITGVVFLSMIVSQLIQNSLFFTLSQLVPFVEYHLSLGEIAAILLTTVTSIFLGMLPMYVGMFNKSTVATVVSSILIVALTVSSGGQDGSGLITMVPVSVTLGILGAGCAGLTIKKMLSEDIIL